MSFMTNLLRLTLTDPKAAGEHIVSLRLSVGVALSAFCVTIIMAVILMFVLSGFKPTAMFPGLAPMSPVNLFAIMGFGTLGLVGCIWLSARAFGGAGRFSDGILVFSDTFSISCNHDITWKKSFGPMVWRASSITNSN